MTETETKLPAISRRAFFFGSAAAGALTFLGAAHTKSGVIYAYAADPGEKSFAVVMLGRDEISVLAVDPSTSKVVPNMKVHVASHASAATVSSIDLTTNEQGFATAHVRDMSENRDEDDPVGGYGFWASVEGSASGYRDFAADLVRVQTGPAPQGADGKRPASITVPTQPYNAASQPGYLRKLSFDGNDIQYSQATFVACSGNDAEHTLDAQIVAAAGKRVSVRFLYDGAELGSAQGTTGGDGRVSLQVKGAFLKGASPNGKAQVFFEVEGACYEAPCRLSACAGADGLDHAVEKNDATISPGNPDSNPMVDTVDADNLGVYTVFVPEKFPIGGGTKFDLPLPDFPVTAKLNPLGMFAIGVGLDLKPLLPSSDGSADDSKLWKVLKHETWDQYVDRKVEEEAKAVDRYLAAEAIKKGKSKEISQTKFGGLETKFEFTLLAEGDWEWGSSTWSLGLNATILFNMKYSWGRQVFVGPVPVYIGFDIGLNSSASFYIGMEMESGFKNVHWTPDKNGVTIVSRFEVGASAGVGIYGFLSVGVRGYGFIQGTLGLVKTEHEFPHLAVGAGVGITLVWQVLFASGTIGLYNYQWPHIYDNWPHDDFTLGAEDTLSMPAAFRNSAASYTLGEGETLDLQSCPPALITAEKLAALAEFDAQVDELAAADGSIDASFDYDYRAEEKETLAKFSEIGVVAADEAAQTAEESGSEYIPSLGAVPAVDRLIYEGVTSDSRHKVIRSADGSWYLCRLCVVNVGIGLLAGADRSIVFNRETGLFERLETPQTVLVEDPQPTIVRPRVTMCKLTGEGTWSAPQVIDFGVEPNSVEQLRANFYDYDFDVCEDLSSPGTFYFNVVSGVVGATDEDSFEYRWRNQCVTFVRYRYNDARVLRQVSKADVLGSATSYSPHVLYHAGTSTPFFFWAKAQPKGEGAVYTLNIRGYDELLEREMSMCLFKPYGYSTAAPLYLDFHAGKGPGWTDDANNPLLLWVAPQVKDMAVVANSYQVHMCPYNDKYHAIGWGSVNLENVTCPVIVPDHGWIYTSTADDGKAEGADERTGEPRELIFATRTSESKTVVERGAGIANITSFGASADGSRLFAARCQEGEAPSSLAQDLNPGADSEVLGVSGQKGAEEVRRYSIYAANWDAKRQSYHKFYPFCQSDHPLDVVDCVDLGRGAASFISTEIVNAQDGKGDIYQMNVPLLCSVQLEAATTMDLFCGVGDVCHVTLRVQNNGNLPVRGFEAYLFDTQDYPRRPLASKGFDALADSMYPAVEDWRYNDEDGNAVHMTDEVYLASKDEGSGLLRANLSDEDMNNLLWPGEARTYGTIDFVVPDSWAGKGEVTVYASIGNAVADEDALSDALGQAAPDFAGSGSDAGSDSAEGGGAGDGEAGLQASALAASGEGDGSDAAPRVAASDGSDSSSVAVASAQLGASSGFATVGTLEADSNGVFTDVDGKEESFTITVDGDTRADDVAAADYTPVNAAAAEADGSAAVKTSDESPDLAGPLTVFGAAGLAALAAYEKRRSDNEKAEQGSGASA